jgi:hypothetical protein
MYNIFQAKRKIIYNIRITSERSGDEILPPEQWAPFLDCLLYVLHALYVQTNVQNNIELAANILQATIRSNRELN